MIIELQIASAFIMTLMAILLAFILPRYTSTGKIYNHARKLLIAGAILIILHSIVQYYIQKKIPTHLDLRTTINLFFGFPISYCINMSLIFLQRRGRINLKEKLFSPILYVTAIILFIYINVQPNITKGFDFSSFVITMLYGISLLFYSSLLIQGYIRIKRSIRRNSNLSFIPLIKWTKWSLFILTIVSLGFPIMAFNTCLLTRTLYSILSLVSAFFYMIGFILYGLSTNKNSIFSSSKGNIVNEPINENEGVPIEDIKPQLNLIKSKQMEIAVKEFIDKGEYLTPQLTIKIAAEKMGVNCNMLRTWVKNTPYQKFSNWILALRIQKAKEILIENPNISQEEIAERCGFCDRQYFQKLFRQQEGMSPSKWISIQSLINKNTNHHDKD